MSPPTPRSLLLRAQTKRGKADTLTCMAAESLRSEGGLGNVRAYANNAIAALREAEMELENALSELSAEDRP